MSIAHLRKWDVTAIEIALDLEMPRNSHLAFSGPSEPRICLVATFALTSQLKRIVAAVDRAVPTRPPSGLRITPSTPRSASNAAPSMILIQPILALLRLQSKLIRAIEPGIAYDPSPITFKIQEMDKAAERFVRDFLPCKALPVFEPPVAAYGYEATDLRANGITIYCLGRRGAPETILAHWAYSQDAPGSLHLESGP
jgi:hypothetical protein